MTTTPQMHHALWTATDRGRTFPSSQRELVAASLLARPETIAGGGRTELTFPRV